MSPRVNMLVALHLLCLPLLMNAERDDVPSNITDPFFMPPRHNVIVIAPQEINNDRMFTVMAYSVNQINMTILNDVAEPLEQPDQVNNANQPQWYLSDPLDGIHHLRIVYRLQRANDRVKVLIRLDKANSSLVEMHFPYRFRTVDFGGRVLLDTNKPQYNRGEVIQITVVYLSKNPMNDSRVTVELKNDAGHVIYRWESLKLIAAYRVVSYQIPRNASPGMWRIDASVGRIQKSVNVQVHGHQTSAVPMIQIDPLYWDHHEHNHPTDRSGERITVRACANQTNGQPAHGQAKLALCTCGNMDLYGPDESTMDSADSEQLTRSELCTGGELPCAVSYQLFDQYGCVNGSFALYEFAQFHERFYKKTTFAICIRMQNSLTGMWHSKCVVRRYSRRNSLRRQIKPPPYYKNGLPMGKRIFTADPIYAGPRMVMELTEVLNHCEDYKNRSYGEEPVSRPLLPRRIYVRIHPRELWNDYAIIPPLFSDQPLAVTFDHEERRYMRSYWELMHKEHMLPENAHSGESIQVWSGREGPVEVGCDGIVRLPVIGNRRLTEKRFYVYASADGDIQPLDVIENKEQLKKDDACRDEDGPLGHYKCLDGDEDQTDDKVECVRGWKGRGCLEAICAEDCNSTFGFCSQPGDCVCHEGWVGALCNECEYCYRNQCWIENSPYNWTCPSEKALTDVQYGVRNPESNIIRTSFAIRYSNRSIYRRTVEVKLKPSMYGTIPVTVFYFVKLDRDDLEMISTHAFVHRPTYCESRGTDNSGVYLSKTEGAPGDLVHLRVVPSQDIISGPNITCHIRVWDERSTRMPMLRNQLNIEADHNRFMQDHGLFDRPEIRASSEYDLWAMGLQQAILTRRNKEAKYCSGQHSYFIQKSIVHRVEPWPVVDVLYESVKLDESKPLIEYNFSIAEHARALRAGALCHGEADVVWSAGSMSLLVHLHYHVDVHLPKMLKLLEVAPVSVRLNLRSTLFRNPRRCVWAELTLESTDSALLTLSGPDQYRKCSCGPELINLTNSVMANLAGEGAIDARVYLDLTEDDCRYDNRKRTLIHSETYVIELFLGDNDHSTSSLFLCQNVLDEAPAKPVAAYRLSIPQRVNDSSSSTWSRTYFNYDLNLIGPIVRYFGHVSKRPIISAYQSLANIVTGIRLIDYLGHESLMHRALIRRAYLAIQSAYIHLTRFFECKDSSVYALPFFANKCDGPIDWELTLATYHTFGIWRRYSHSSAFANYRTLGAKCDSLFKLFNKTVHWECEPKRNTTVCENQLELLSLWVVGNKANIHASYSVTQRIIRRAALVKRWVQTTVTRRIQSNQTDWNRIGTTTLARLAHALSLSKHSYIVLPIIHELMQRRVRIAKTKGNASTIQQVYWRDKSTNDVIEPTFHAYMALSNMNYSLTQLEPIIRWLTKRYNMYGEMKNERERFYGNQMMFDFMSHVIHQPIKHPTAYIRGVDGRMRRLMPLRLNEPSILLNPDERQIQWFLNSTDAATPFCAWVQLGREILRRPNQSDKVNVVISSSQSTATLSVCPRSSKSRNRILIYPQTGWLLTNHSIQTGHAVRHPRVNDVADVFDVNFTSKHDCLRVGYTKTMRIATAQLAKITLHDLASHSASDPESVYADFRSGPPDEIAGLVDEPVFMCQNLIDYSKDDALANEWFKRIQAGCEQSRRPAITLVTYAHPRLMVYRVDTQGTVMRWTRPHTTSLDKCNAANRNLSFSALVMDEVNMSNTKRWLLKVRPIHRSHIPLTKPYVVCKSLWDTVFSYVI